MAIPWPVEVNPRYTASVEIHELASGRPLLPEHRAACEGSDRAGGGPRGKRAAATQVAGKWIVYAPQPMVIPESTWDEGVAADPGVVPAIADIPAPGTSIEAGEPVMTILARDWDVGACQARLSRLQAVVGVAAGTQR